MGGLMEGLGMKIACQCGGGAKDKNRQEEKGERRAYSSGMLGG